MARDARLRLKLDIIITYGTPLPLLAALVLPSVRPRVARLVKVRHLFLVSEWIITRTHAAMRGLVMTERVSPWTLVMLCRG